MGSIAKVAQQALLIAAALLPPWTATAAEPIKLGCSVALTGGVAAERQADPRAPCRSGVTM